MRLLGWLLIAVCLTSGSIAASTAYMPRVSLADERFEIGVVDDKPVHLELKSVAGAQFSGDNSKARLQRLGAIPPDPSFVPGTALDGYALDSLRGDGAAVTVGTSVRRSNRVAVSEFSLARWDTWWLFLLSVIGLTGGAMLLRKSAAADLARRATTADGEAPALSPIELLQRAAEKTAALSAAIPSAHDRCAAVLNGVSAIQREDLDPFVEGRLRIAGERGLSAYASIMDAFAGAERSYNRAWSAAADGHEPEAVACVDEAAARLAQAIERLRV